MCLELFGLYCCLKLLPLLPGFVDLYSAASIRVMCFVGIVFPCSAVVVWPSCILVVQCWFLVWLVVLVGIWLVAVVIGGS